MSRMTRTAQRKPFRMNTRPGWPVHTEFVLKCIEVTGRLDFFVAIRRGLMFSLPLILIGAFAILLRDLPIPALQRQFGNAWTEQCNIIINATFGIGSLVVLIGFTHARTERHNQRHTDQAVSPIIAVVVVLASFFIVVAPVQAEHWQQTLSLDKGLLFVLLVAPISCFLFLQLGTALRRLRPSPGSLGYDPLIRDILQSMPAAILTIALAWLLLRPLPMVLLSELRTYLPWLKLTPSNAPGPAMAYMGLCQLLWFFGAHGPNLLYAVEHQALIPASQANIAALAGGHAPSWIFTKEFFDTYTRMGGSGSTLSLIGALLLTPVDRGSRRFALFALLPALCNVNEPLLFGLPLILNPVYLIPFLATPLLQTLIAYTAISLGWVPHTIATVAWTTPALLGGYLATHSLAGTGLQAVNLAIGIALYLPFVRLGERLRARRCETQLKRLQIAAERFDQTNTRRKVLDLPGEEGRLAEMLANDLDRALHIDGQLWLAFQPQLRSSDGTVSGIEALLRWRHPVFGPIPAPLTVALAEDRGWHARLGRHVLRNALRQRAAWLGQVPDTLLLAVNITPWQLRDPAFADEVLALLTEYNIPTTVLELEITESTVLLPNATTLAMLLRLREAGVRIALDDFGMGHTSLRYLHALPIDSLKIDRSLTQATPNEINDHIVRSIIELSHCLDIATVVEGVEDTQQLERFVALGCDHFQGYLFSPPLPADACLRFIQERQPKAARTENLPAPARAPATGS
jgi:cellobiose PTS system EIIC component